MVRTKSTRSHGLWMPPAGVALGTRIHALKDKRQQTFVCWRLRSLPRLLTRRPYSNRELGLAEVANVVTTVVAA
jgi:hypothetical protein